MRIMKAIIKYITAIAAVLALGSCTDNFDEYNTNKYEPTDLPLASYFPSMFDCLASPEENPCQRNNSFWACFGGYVTAPQTWSRSTLFSTWNVDDNWNKWSVEWYYDKFYPSYFTIEQRSEGKGYFFQMARLLRIATMHYVLSFQGPLPYSQMSNGQYAVAYDDEKTAWHAMIDDLDEVIEELTSAAATSSAKPLASVDYVYGGDTRMWVKFANSLKLRMAMRISSVDPEYAKTKAEEAVAHSIGVMTAASDSAYDNLNGRYKNGYFTVGDSWGEMRANACITAYMNGYNDPRRAAYFREAELDGGGYIGVRSGDPNATPAKYAQYSRMKVEQTTPMAVFYASEAWFLRAEGALKGWNMGGTVQQLYEQGVRTSFDEWGASGVDAYLADNTSLPGNYTDPVNSSMSIANQNKTTIAWDESATAEKKLERIITQKWIANFPLGLEGWSDFRRTGYPYIFPAQTNRSAQGITNERGQRRLRFSEDEYSTNSANVQAAVKMLSNGQDSDNTDLWWAKKN